MLIDVIGFSVQMHVFATVSKIALVNVDENMLFFHFPSFGKPWTILSLSLKLGFT